MSKIKILIADDHPAVRYGLRSVLQLDNNFDIVAEVNNGKEAIDYILKYPVDLAIIDVNMPERDGIDTTKKLKKIRPAVKIIGFSIYDDQHKVLNMLKAGADGYLLKSADRNEIAEAITTVMRGQRFVSKEVSDKVIYNVVSGATAKAELKDDDEGSLLSKREEEILGLLANDNSYVEIAQKLGISKRTVDTHRYNISKKLGIKSIAGLIRYALNHDLV